MKPSLFLDRDGVINVRKPGDYVKSPQEFVPEHKALEAIALLRPHFEHVFVVTNQAGIGKELMTAFDLRLVHFHLQDLVENTGGSLDHIFHCPHRSDAGCFCRKPLTGMAWQALALYSDLDFEQCWMVGDSASDMQFGKNLNMKTVLIEGKTEDEATLLKLKPMYRFASLWQFAEWFSKI